MPTPARDLAAIEAELRRFTAARSVKVAARDRRDADMLRALADVEQYEADIRSTDAHLDELLDERDQLVHPERYAPDARIGPTP
ncbi:hypothetical protein [Blastococcus sp. CT_GayMR16]|uniref:hypothetical protein n=1 Tax=Blastococcus sp. CT_GayMR16 TaxID=2559607 RepID=UPI00142FD711|nr:hypothetical protein [Blastococcus sp. CT_GayMR16]